MVTLVTLSYHLLYHFAQTAGFLQFIFELQDITGCQPNYHLITHLVFFFFFGGGGGGEGGRGEGHPETSGVVQVHQSRFRRKSLLSFVRPTSQWCHASSERACRNNT